MGPQATSAENQFPLLDTLRRFNRKERFFLVGQALDNPTFRLGTEFSSRLNKELSDQVPEDAFVFVAMDYHLDCLYAALALSRKFQPHYETVPQTLKGTQQDIDLVVAWQSAGASGVVSHVVMIEAKGVMPFSNRQLQSKVNRLAAIFGHDGKSWPDVKPVFLIASPKQSQKIVTSAWPPWTKLDGRPRWLELRVPSDLLRATRCDAKGTVTHLGSHWKVLPKQ